MHQLPQALLSLHTRQHWDLGVHAPGRSSAFLAGAASDCKLESGGAESNAAVSALDRSAKWTWLSRRTAAAALAFDNHMTADYPRYRGSATALRAQLEPGGVLKRDVKDRGFHMLRPVERRLSLSRCRS